MAIFVNICSAESLIRHLADIQLRTRCLKGAVALAEHHEHLVLGPIINCDVKFLVTVEIRNGNSVRMRIAFNVEW